MDNKYCKNKNEDKDKVNELIKFIKNKRRNKIYRR